MSTGKASVSRNASVDFLPRKKHRNGSDRFFLKIEISGGQCQQFSFTDAAPVEHFKSVKGNRLVQKDRIFTVTKSYLHHEMDRGAKAAGVKRIRIHDLRHSHISLLIDMGFSAVAIADRVGHESIDITYQYAHLFPSKQTEMADRLDDLGKGEIENVS